jgi:membrane protein
VNKTKNKGAVISSANSSADRQAGSLQRRIWTSLSRSCFGSLWNLQGIRLRVLAERTWSAMIADRLFGHAAELGFYFLFALFPTLFCASSVLGLVLRSGHSIHLRLLSYLALVIPASALQAVLAMFYEMVTAASSGKITVGSIVALWSASAGVSAIQDTLNVVHKLNEARRSYLLARIQAIGLTILVVSIGVLTLASMFAADFLAEFAERQILDVETAMIVAFAARITGWTISIALVALAISFIYYWAPDWENPHWHWLTPGAGVAILGWFAASLGFRFYLHHFNSYTVTYGALGAVTILMTWFYITGLMLLLGAEIDSVIRASTADLCPILPRNESSAPSHESS